MKRFIKYLGLVIVLGLGLNGCYKDVINPGADPDGPAQAVSFKEELAPLLQTKCALSGCHIAGSYKPHLEDLNKSYVNIVGGGFVNTLVPKESILYKQVNGSMSEFLPSKEDKQKIYDWIRNGAPKN